MNSILQKLDAITAEIESLRELVKLKRELDTEPISFEGEPTSKTCQTLQAPFEGFNVLNTVHSCYLMLCYKSDSKETQNEIIKQYLADSGQPHDFNSIEAMRKAIFYLSKSKQLKRPWRDKPRQSEAD